MAQLPTTDSIQISNQPFLCPHAEPLLVELKRRATALANQSIRPDIATEVAFHGVISGIHEVCAATRGCEDAGLSREDMEDALRSLREACRESPFIRHITEWPSGFPGDFRIVDRICQATNTAPPGTLGYWLEEYSLVCGMAQQHRNKVQRQAHELLSMVRATIHRSIPCRLLVLACGGCPDLESVQDELADLPFQGTAIDQDPEAIEASRHRLKKLSDRIDFIEGNVIRRIPELSRKGQFELIVAGGLFDYLPDRIAAFLIKQVCSRLLAPGGRFFFTNIARGNPYEDWTRYVCDWRLIQRSEPDLNALLGAAGECMRVRFERDLTRLTFFVTADAPAEWNNGIQ